MRLAAKLRKGKLQVRCASLRREVSVFATLSALVAILSRFSAIVLESMFAAVFNWGESGAKIRRDDPEGALKSMGCTVGMLKP